MAANPYLVAKDQQPVAASFHGTEWGDEIGAKELPLRARVVTTRLALLAWGAVFKIEFTAIESQATKPRTLLPRYFIATDDQIALLNAEDPEAAIAQLKTLAKAPELAPEDIYAITKGQRTYQGNKNTTAKLEVSGARCVYRWSHTSGHFTTVVWKRGVGLVEFAQGRGARADGYRLLRAEAAGKQRR